MRVINWFRNWFVAVNIPRYMEGVNQRLTQLDRNRVKSAKLLRRRTKELDKIQASLLVKAEEVATDLEQAQTIQRQYTEQLEIARGEKRIADTMVSALVAANRVLLERWEAESTIQVMRQVGHSPGQQE